MGITILVLVLLYSMFKWWTYYHSTRGLLYYLGKKYDDMPDTEKMKELISKSVERTLSELCKKS